jgi:hypothetical protein
LAQAAELTELSVTQVQRMRAAAAGETRSGSSVMPAFRPGEVQGEAVRSLPPHEEAGQRAAS